MAPRMKQFLRDAGLPRIYQLGIVVKSVPESVRFYTDVMGIAPWYRGEVGSQETVYHGQRVEMEADMVFAYSDKLMIELVEPKTQGPDIYNDFLQERGEGLHHLGIEVKDFDRKLKKLTSMGIEVIQSGTVVSKGGAVSKMAYLDTTRQCGYPIELMETRLFGLPVGKGQFMMNVGCLLGDASRVKV